MVASEEKGAFILIAVFQVLGRPLTVNQKRLFMSPLTLRAMNHAVTSRSICPSLATDALLGSFNRRGDRLGPIAGRPAFRTGPQSPSRRLRVFFRPLRTM